MSEYTLLARQMLDIIDGKKHPPIQDGVSRCVRGEMAVMRFLQQAQGRQIVGDICRELGMTTSRIAAVLNSLEKKGLIRRAADEADKRRVFVALTPEGEDFCTARRNEFIEHISHTLEALGEHDAREFVRIIQRITSLQNKEESH